MIFEKWDSGSGSWIDISQYIERKDEQIELDLLGTYEIQQNGQSYKLDAGSVSVAEGDYMRIREEGAAVNYVNMIKGNDSDMNASAGTHWGLSGLNNNPVFDIDSTVSGKMFFDMNGESVARVRLNFNMLVSGKSYRVRVKLRYRSGSGAKMYFGDDPVTSTAQVSFLPTATEATYEGTFTADNSGREFYIGAKSDDGLANTSQFEIDDIELYVESDPVIYSGFAANLIKSVRTNKVEFDLIPEISDLKSKPVQLTLSGSNLYERLLDAMPSDYVLVEMDSTAESVLNSAPSGLTGIIYPGDQVLGTDSNNYHCIQKHKSTTDDKPITGANWATYWQSGGANGVAWEFDKTYDVRYFNDVLYDTIAIGNAVSQGNNHIYCVVVNKELRIYGRNVNDTPTSLTASKLNDIFEDDSEEIVTGYYDDYVNDSLRGEGALTIGNQVTIDWKKTEHKILSTEKFKLMQLLQYNAVDYGMITSISKKGLMYTYLTTRLERVP